MTQLHDEAGGRAGRMVCYVRLHGGLVEETRTTTVSKEG
jgi:hypothetical protein